MLGKPLTQKLQDQLLAPASNHKQTQMMSYVNMKANQSQKNLQMGMWQAMMGRSLLKK